MQCFIELVACVIAYCVIAYYVIAYSARPLQHVSSEVDSNEMCFAQSSALHQQCFIEPVACVIAYCIHLKLPSAVSTIQSSMLALWQGCKVEHTVWYVECGVLHCTLFFSTPTCEKLEWGSQQSVLHTLEVEVVLSLIANTTLMPVLSGTFALAQCSGGRPPLG